MIRTQAFLLVLAWLAAGCSVARGCTAEEAAARRTQVSLRFQALLLNDPDRANALLPRMRALADADRANRGELDWNRICAGYDRALSVLR